MLDFKDMDWWDFVSKILRPVLKWFDPNEWQVRRLWTVSYTHLTLPTNREV